MIYQDDIASLKSNINNNIGQKIIVKGSLGRSKLFEKEATIEKAYPNIFVVKYEENERSRRAFSGSMGTGKAGWTAGRNR